MDQIRIEELKIFAYHGVFDQENQNGQNFYVNAVLYLDTENAGYSDCLDCSVDYGAVCKLIETTMTEHVYQLIETVAQKMAEAILFQYPLVKSVEVEVRKPDAPVAMDFKSISVRIRRGWHKAVIALGSNIGDSRAYLQDAVQKLSQDPCIRNLIQSEWISTKPYGYTQQDDFLNGAVSLQTIYSPFRLLRLMQEIENQAGRTREIHWGPRTLDLDLIFYDDAIISDPELVVPHPDMQNRGFVLQPVAEIAPYYMHPVLQKTVRQLLEDLEKSEI